jgi:hypothetical protein
MKKVLRRKLVPLRKFSIWEERKLTCYSFRAPHGLEGFKPSRKNLLAVKIKGPEGP